MILSAIKSKNGVALITGAIVMMMVAMLGVAYMSLSMTNLMRADRDVRRSETFYLAEAGLEYVISLIIEEVQQTGYITARTIDTTSQLGQLHSQATGRVIVTPDAGNPNQGTVVSSATYRGLTESVRVRITARDVSVWNNAIFAGIGQSGRGINGNVDIRGSVHILGEGDPYTDLNGNGVRDDAEPYVDSNHNGHYDSGEPFTDVDGNGLWSPAEPYQDKNLNGIYDPPLTATELAADISGNAYIGNNYYGMPVGLAAKIPALAPINVNGEWVQTLQAQLRVKHGKVNISGSASVGSPNIPCNIYKETLDGVFVSDGWGGNKGASSVYADNGTRQPYDLGDRMTFPSLQDPYTDLDSGIEYTSREAFLDSRSLTIPVTNIKKGVASFSYSDGMGNSISWDNSTSTLTVNGIIRIPSSLDLGSKGDTIYFAGRGTIYCDGNESLGIPGTIKVHGSMLPKTSFPIVDVIGFVAKHDIEFATGPGESQLMAAGAWYAQRTIKSAKQNQFAGTYVANYFDMGTNVPNIYQVPALRNHLPPGMPGGENTVSVQVTSWVHLRPGV